MCWFAVVVGILLSSLAQAQPVEGTPLSQALRLRLEARIDDQPDLHRLYRIMDYEPLWHAGVAGDERRAAVERTLARAADHGLEAVMPLGSAGTPEATAEHDLALSRSLLFSARELRFGRAPQARSSTAWHIEDDDVDLVDGLANAIRRNDLRTFLGALAPLAPDYEALQAARRRLQEILAGGGWPVIPGDAELLIDSRDPRLPLLRARLALEGDLASARRRRPTWPKRCGASSNVTASMLMVASDLAHWRSSGSAPNEESRRSRRTWNAGDGFRTVSATRMSW